MNTHRDMGEPIADLIMTKVPADIKAGNKLQSPAFARECTFSDGGSHFGGERIMKRFLMTMVFAVVFMATSTQAANGKKYFADSTGLSIAEGLDFPELNISFSPGYNEGNALGYDMVRFRVGSIEADKVNGIAAPIDSEIDAGAFDLSDEEDLGYQFRVELGLDVSPTTALTAEYRFLGIAYSDAPNPHGFVFGARFKF